MCGRYASTRSSGALAADFDAGDTTGPEVSKTDHNIAPTKPVLTVVQRHPRDEDGNPDPNRTERTVRSMRWGLVPRWAKDPSMGSRMINARSETVETKPAFRGAIRSFRCLLPADGWYEWDRERTPKQPYFLTPADGSGLAMAGIWATWRDPEVPDAEPLVTCSVLTAEAVGRAARIHERMPMVLPTSSWDRWLDPDEPDVTDLLGPPPKSLVDTLELRPVSRAVNNVRNNGPELVERVSDDEGALFGP